MRFLTFLSLFFLLQALPGLAEEDTHPLPEPTPAKGFLNTGWKFLDDATISGGIYFFQRDRSRFNQKTRGYSSNLDHASAQANIDISSGYLGNILAVEFAAFASADLRNRAAVDHEMNFFPWGDPWSPDWSKTKARDGSSVYKALVKAKYKDLWLRTGYFQPSGPTTLGVNWSIMPGSYRGINAGGKYENFSFAFALADAYKAPWFSEMNDFRKNDGSSDVPYIWSAGIGYNFDTGLYLEAAYGEAKGHLKNAHFKSLHSSSLYSGTLKLGYHLYLMTDNDKSGLSPNDNFAGIARQHYLFANFEKDLWTYRLEGTFTQAKATNAEHKGYFAYRLTDRSGSSKGAYDAWWDARSDWNADNEKALFVGLQRKLDDILPEKGFYAGTGFAFGFDGKGYDYSEHLKEWAFTFDLGYTRQEGPLKDAFIKLHYTRYLNGSDQPSWTGYKNAFEDERDFKLFAGAPFSI